MYQTFTFYIPIMATTKELYNEVKRLIEAERNSYTNIRLYLEDDLIEDGSICLNQF
jgi:hypothetical protein